MEITPNRGANRPPQISPRSHLFCSLLTGRGRERVPFALRLRWARRLLSVGGAWDACWTLCCGKGVGTWRRQNVRPLLALLPRAISEACFRLLTGWDWHRGWRHGSARPLCNVRMPFAAEAFDWLQQTLDSRHTPPQRRAPRDDEIQSGR